MNVENWIALVAAFVAAVAAGVAIFNAHSSSRSADAAEGQLALIRDDSAAQQGRRDDAAGPKFDVAATKRADGEWFAAIEVTQVSGPALERVRVTVSGDDVRGIAPRSGDHDVLPDLEWQHLAQGSKHTVYVQLQYHHTTPTNVRLHFHCVEEGGARSWERSITAVADEAPDRGGSRWLRRTEP